MSKLSWGLIGCGDIARKRIVPALKDLQNCELTAVTRSNSGLAESFAKEFNIPNWFDSWQNLLSDPDINAVYIATPVYLHSQITVAAAQAGKHVLCEKPMALNDKECGKMIEVCSNYKVKLGIAYYRHFYPVIASIKNIINSGEIGEIITAQINAFEFFNPDPGDPRYWLLEKDKSGGGPMFDFGCHRIEVLMNLFGKIKSTDGFIRNILFKRKVEDYASAVFTFESGVTSVLNVTHAVKEPQDTLDIFGSKGSIHVPVLNKGSVIVKSNSGDRKLECPPDKNFHLPLIKDFTEAVLSDSTPVVGGEIGMEVNHILSEIYGQK